MFSDPLFILVAVAVLTVLAILMFGIGNFGRGGEDAAKKSNKLMRWRIYAQAVAVALILLFVYIRGKG